MPVYSETHDVYRNATSKSYVVIEDFFESICVPVAKSVNRHRNTVAFWRQLSQEKISKLFVVQDEKKNGKAVQIPQRAKWNAQLPQNPSANTLYSQKGKITRDEFARYLVTV